MRLPANAVDTTPVTTSLLVNIWNDNLPIILDRLERLDSFAVVALQGQVTPQQQNDALNIAHKMAGSLGIFGFATAGRVAQRLELLLHSAGPLDATQIQRLATALRAALNL